MSKIELFVTSSSVLVIIFLIYWFAQTATRTVHLFL